MKKLFSIALVLFVLIANSCTQTDLNPMKSKKIVVAVFDGNGPSPICVLETLEALKIDTELQGITITPAQIENGKLDSIDVLIFPGGSGSKELNSLGEIGADKVKNFVKEKGKAVLGICAGGFLLSNTPTYPSLKLTDAKNIDRKHYSRGRGLIEVKMTEKGDSIFPELKGHRVFLQYFDGPILAPVDSNQMKYTELAQYVTDIHANPGTPTGITPGRTFMFFEKVGKGRVFVIGGHAESTPGMRWMVPRMVRYVYSGQIISYPKKWIRPEINDKEIMFTPDLQKKEKQLFWNLLDTSDEVQIAAMEELYKLRSRPAVRWSIGLLRDNSPRVRKKAAELLRLTEYTAALPDLKEAYNAEQDQETKKELMKTIKFLSEF